MKPNRMTSEALVEAKISSTRASRIEANQRETSSKKCGFKSGFLGREKWLFGV